MKFLLIIFLLPLKLLAQNVTGVWTGTLYNDTTKQYLKYELAISENNRKLNGYSYTIFLIDSVENIGVKSVKIKKSDNHYFIEDDKLIDNNYIEPPAKGVKTYSDLVLTETDSSLILSGPWKTNRTKVYESITGRILLHRKKEIQETLIIPKLEKLGLANSLSFMSYDNYSKNVTTVNKPVVNSDSNNKIQQRNTKKENLLAKNNLNNSAKKEENQSKEKQLSTAANLNITDTAQRKKISVNNQTSVKDAALNKKRDTTFSDNDIAASKSNAEKNVNNKGKKILEQATETPKTVQPKNDVSKVSAINTESDEKKGKKKNDQLITVKNLSKNKEVTHAYAPPVIKAAADISSRKIETVQSVEIKNDSLLLTLYDNGEIDGDTVSILLNGKVIMPMQGLTAKGITKTIYLTPEMGDSISLIMYAENLGSIPPNTGLLIVYDGNVRHEIRFSGDLQKNSAIILKRKKLH